MFSADNIYEMLLAGAENCGKNGIHVYASGLIEYTLSTNELAEQKVGEIAAIIQGTNRIMDDPEIPYFPVRRLPGH